MCIANHKSSSFSNYQSHRQQRINRWSLKIKHRKHRLCWLVVVIKPPDTHKIASLSEMILTQMCSCEYISINSLRLLYPVKIMVASRRVVRHTRVLYIRKTTVHVYLHMFEKISSEEKYINQCNNGCEKYRKMISQFINLDQF